MAYVYIVIPIVALYILSIILIVEHERYMRAQEREVGLR